MEHRKYVVYYWQCPCQAWSRGPGIYGKSCVTLFNYRQLSSSKIDKLCSFHHLQETAWEHRVGAWTQRLCYHNCVLWFLFIAKSAQLTLFAKVGLTMLLLVGRTIVFTRPSNDLKDISVMMLPTSRLLPAVKLDLSWNNASLPYIATDIRGMLPVVSFSRVEEMPTIAGGTFSRVLLFIWLNRSVMLGVKILAFSPSSSEGSSTRTPNSGAANWNGFPGATLEAMTLSTLSTMAKILHNIMC